MTGVHGLRQDIDKAMKYFDKAITLGYLPSMHTKAFLLATGFGGRPKDEKEAIKLEEHAALAGFFQSSMVMGYRYLHGKGVPKDCERALIFYKVRNSTAIIGMA